VRLSSVAHFARRACMLPGGTGRFATGNGIRQSPAGRSTWQPSWDAHTAQSLSPCLRCLHCAGVCAAAAGLGVGGLRRRHRADSGVCEQHVGQACSPPAGGQRECQRRLWAAALRMWASRGAHQTTGGSTTSSTTSPSRPVCLRPQCSRSFTLLKNGIKCLPAHLELLPILPSLSTVPSASATSDCCGGKGNLSYGSS